MTNIKVSGEWKNQGASFVKVENSWRSISRSFVKIGGVWRDATFGSPPAKPIMQYVSTGVFQINNYNSSLTYQAIFKAGSGGTATLNTSNGRYTLSGTWSGFDVISRYAPGAPASIAGYMERKPYSFSCRQTTVPCSFPCNCRFEPGNCGCLPPGPNGCPPGSSPNGQCGCGNTFPDLPCMFGTIGGTVCDTCQGQCPGPEICDVLIQEPQYKNSGTEWYKDDV